MRFKFFGGLALGFGIQFLAAYLGLFDYSTALVGCVVFLLYYFRLQLKEGGGYE